MRLWAAQKDEHDRVSNLRSLGAGLAARGVVTSIHVTSDGQFVVGAVGRHPRLGCWLSDPTAINGIVVHRLDSI